MALDISLLVAASAVSLVIILIRRLASNSASTRLAHFPRGPPTLPLLGNLHQMPLSRDYLTYADWAGSSATSSDGILGLKLGSTVRVVVLNRWRQVRDLLDARGAIYSSRPRVPATEFVLPPPGDVHTAFMEYGPKWRRTRRAITEFTKDDALERLLPIQDAESTQLIWDLLQDSSSSSSTADNGRYQDHAFRSFAGVILASVFGQRAKDSDPAGKARRFFDVQEDWAAILAGGAFPPLNVFPWLRHVPSVLTPWKGWRERAADIRRRQQGLYEELHAETVERMRAGKSQDCFFARLIAEQDQLAQAGKGKEVFTQLELTYIGGFMLEGGSDTTAMAFLTLALAMAAFPDIQKEAQAELDAVFGTENMPHSVSGRELPFLKACFLETLRWRPGLTTAIPHATTADDTYKGYFIPKGTAVMMNTWAINHDPDEFDEPDEFRPSRFLTNRFGAKGDKTNANERGEEEEEKGVGAGEDHKGRREAYAFGAGRRVCPGQKMAETSVMLSTAKLLWAFDVRSPAPRVDTGVRTAFSDSILMGPNKFPVVFEVRSESKREVIRREWEKADAFMGRFE
ncbi:cytochrome P450 3A24 [Magnaporthiopsis poae ATCC 64411]|uniref:Cytochrome P450 3A24 n=1 Tax=Magnaporthiopsis poae (strain ATCC 64411 / 73-15) TaxID=644358 RepID=A0A0C4E9C5_MAGP6|nr:cytochrome P450 3A24 [Magnaporthiopsis poae ATCC 64411]